MVENGDFPEQVLGIFDDILISCLHIVEVAQFFFNGYLDVMILLEPNKILNFKILFYDIVS
jgi:hypothetical protein